MTTTTNKPIEIIDAVYNYRIYAWYGDKMSFVLWGKQHLGFTNNDVQAILNMDAEGQMVPMAGALCIFIDSKLALDHYVTVLAHECQHASFKILKERGVTYSYKSEEAFTYHTSWLATLIMDSLTHIPPTRRKAKKKIAK
jgi:hypothetical protein